MKHSSAISARCALFLIILPAIIPLTAREIKPTDSRLRYDGCFFPKTNGNTIGFPRFSGEAFSSATQNKIFNGNNANTTTGVVMNFFTDSPEIRLFFSLLPGTLRYNEFGIYRNGQFQEIITIPKTESNFIIKITAPDKKSAGYEVVFPSWANPLLERMEIPDGADLFAPAPDKRPVYVAIGDSITHGTGQSTSCKSYPFILSRSMGWNLYNIAVGGSKIAPMLGPMTEDKRIDFITILIGYNDWNSGNTLEAYVADYHTLLDSLRSRHPAAIIFCLTATTSKSAESRTKKTVPLEAYRTAVRDIVKQKIESGDKSIYLIEGPEISTEADLNDQVHFSEDGAKNVSGKLEAQIKQRLIQYR
ncbi:MAG: hypothetical protein A2096_06140 [Spirochaetes bacterium GWF1_41_5]|nr:MAG: hypothetical protein A2096_06140 [Spirochaetes bacterium GWF1_41_5]